eukprot:403362554
MLSISQHSRVHSGFLSKPFLKRDFSVMQNQFDNEGKTIKASDYNLNQKVSALQSTQCNEESKQFYSHQVTLNEKNQHSNHTRTISKLSLFDQQSKTSFSKKQLSGSQFTRHYKHDSQPLIVHNSLIKENTEELEEIPVDIKTEDDQVQRRSFSHKMIIPYLINFDSVASIENNNKKNQKQNKFQSSIALNKQESPQKSFQQTVKETEANNGIQNNQSQDKTQKIRKVSLIDIRKAKFDSGITDQKLHQTYKRKILRHLQKKNNKSLTRLCQMITLSANFQTQYNKIYQQPLFLEEVSQIELQQALHKTQIKDKTPKTHFIKEQNQPTGIIQMPNVSLQLILRRKKQLHISIKLTIIIQDLKADQNLQQIYLDLLQANKKPALKQVALTIQNYQTTDKITMYQSQGSS